LLETFEDFSIFMQVFAVVLIVFFTLQLLKRIPFTKDLAKSKITSFRRSFFHNGLIRTIQVSFMKTTTTGLGLTAQMWLQG